MLLSPPVQVDDLAFSISASPVGMKVLLARMVEVLPDYAAVCMHCSGVAPLRVLCSGSPIYKAESICCFMVLLRRC